MNDPLDQIMTNPYTRIGWKVVRVLTSGEKVSLMAEAPFRTVYHAEPGCISVQRGMFFYTRRDYAERALEDGVMGYARKNQTTDHFELWEIAAEHPYPVPHRRILVDPIVEHTIHSHPDLLRISEATWRLWASNRLTKHALSKLQFENEVERAPLYTQLCDSLTWLELGVAK